MKKFDPKINPWILIPLLLLGALVGSLNEWAPLFVFLGVLVFALLLKGTDAFQKLYFLSIPLSIYMTLPGGSAGLMLPSEIMAGIIFFFTLFNILTNNKLNLSLFDHPVSFCLCLLWIGLVIASINSNLPLVSLKALLVFTVYLVVFYFQWMLHADVLTLEKIMSMLRYYFFGMVIVVIITVFKHASFGFDRSMAMRMTPPFFSDHTLYGACLAFFIPLCYYWIKTSKAKLLYSIGFLLIALAIFLTYSRAVWMSLIAVLLLNYILHLKVSFKRLSITLVSIVVLFLVFQDTALSLLSGNQSDSKARKAQVSDQLKSVTNISTDVSNLERINRWKSAMIMFSQKPITGYGPGTYQFNFIPFQRDEDKTSISVSYASNRFSQGMGGTAHSQYLLYAAESGIFVLLAFIATLFFTMKEGFRLYYESTDEKEKILIKALLGGYITFVFHSFFNNFLDIDKAAAVFLLFNAAIVVLSITKRKTNQPLKTIE